MSDLDELDQLEAEMVGKLVTRRDGLEQRLVELKREQMALSAQLQRVRRHLGLLGVGEPRKKAASRNGSGTRISHENLVKIVQAASEAVSFTSNDMVAAIGLQKSAITYGFSVLREREIITPLGKAPREPGQIGPTANLYKIVKENADAFLAEA